MCGIVGVIRFDKEAVRKEQLQVMMQKIKHRGPNGEGTFLANNIGLGLVSLNPFSSTDAGYQPMTDGSGRYTIIKDGNVYNHQELRDELQRMGYEFQSSVDAEVILNGYKAWGEKVLNKINGTFSVAIYDKKFQTLFLARDRFGAKPLYYCVMDKELLFASEIPALLAAIHTKPTANENAIFDYIVFNRTDQTEQTFFNGIFKLQHGCCMTLNCQKIYTKTSLPITKWYDLAQLVQGQTIKGDKDEYMRRLSQAIQLRLDSNVPWGVGLSGGLDSSSITSTVVNVFKESKVHSFSAVFGKDNSADESQFIDYFKGIVPNMHYVHPTADMLFANIDNFVSIQGEPITSTTQFVNYCVMQEAHKYVKIILDGQGADEALSGYEYIPGLYYKTLFTHFKWVTLLKELVNYARLHHSMRHIKYMLFFMLPSKMRTKVLVTQRAYMNPDFVARHQHNVIADQLYGASTMQEMLIRHFEYKLEHLLKWGDRVATAFSMDSRQPFLDKDLVEYSLIIEDGFKIRNGYTKYILREVMQGIMPEPVRMRVDKKGFSVPENQWFCTEKFQTFIMNILQSDSFRKRGFIKPDKAISLYKKHLKGEVDVATDIWKWINLELWYRKFID